MKNLKKFLIFILTFWVLLTLFFSYRIKVDRRKEEERIQNLWFSKYHVVAHALGAIDGYSYTNSLEAFEINYKKGTRLFEVDFGITSDKQVVLTHGWKEHKQKRLNLAYADDKPMSYKEFMNSKIYGKYQPLDLKNLISLMQKYKDFYLILDFGKELDWNEQKQVDRIFEVDNLISYNKMIIDEFKKVDESLLKRVIPQIYYEDHYKKLDKIYHFDNYIYTLYKNYQNTSPKQIMDFINENKIDVITTNLIDKQAITTKELLRQFNLNRTTKKSKAIFIHTINDIKDAEKLIKDGYKGVYTDILNEGDLKYEDIQK